ncbi:hypothetical protein L208DRAFT_1274542 [Tricholoma matsutake]|nr:hypothetical protein L208DRAFT_1274542 [Tricholoma matsutake 945]
MPPSHRPFTRSQTGYVPKRRRRDDSPPVAFTKRTTSPSRKKRKASSKIPSEDSYPDTPQEQNESGVPSKRSASEASTIHSITISPSPSTQLPSLVGSSSSTTSSTADTSSDRRGPRSRVILPIPVPNLTKKSRGRRVPTKLGTANGSANDAGPKDARMYVCNVESCRKCFHRGEHLKRHIRSIHTHDKPFACLRADCDKRFNRHDNLLQHLKVHRDLSPPSPTIVKDAGSSLQTRRSSTPTPPPAERYPAHEAYEMSINQGRRAAAFRRQPSYVEYDHTSYEPTSESTRLITNMAVSSLRTEIPHSPV